MAWNIPTQQKVAATLPAGFNHVCVLIPHFGSVQLEWVNSTYIPLCYVAQADFAKSHKLSRGILNLDTHRNTLTRMALEDKSVTHLLWIDSDVVAESPSDINQALRMLLQCNVPIVSGLYRAKKAKGDYPYAMWSKPIPTAEGYASIGTWTGNFLKVDAIGFGFCLVKREVFDKVPPPWFIWNSQKSEDFEFCEKVAKYGFDIKVYTDCRVSHILTGKVKTDGMVTLLDV